MQKARMVEHAGFFLYIAEKCGDWADAFAGKPRSYKASARPV